MHNTALMIGFGVKGKAHATSPRSVNTSIMES